MSNSKAVLQALSGNVPDQIPIWLMRQAGRYLPEYRQVRSKYQSFLDLCYNPVAAAEVTLQPVRRFDFDASILFSDILVIPDALGQKVEFLKGEGPCLEPVTDVGGLAAFDPAKITSYLEPVFETVALVRSELPRHVTLIGFCGAPWTVATYMVSGRGTKDQAEARLWAYRDPDGFCALIDILVESSILYLKRQIQAGAEALQIFDTWAGSLAESERDNWCIKPLKRIATGIREAHPDVPIIAFLRGAPSSYPILAELSEIDCVGIDTAVPAHYAADLLQHKKCVQGNLDPLALLAGGNALDAGIDQVLEAFAGGPHIFNLGHGILPETPIAHVEHLIEKVRAFR